MQRRDTTAGEVDTDGNSRSRHGSDDGGTALSHDQPLVEPGVGAAREHNSAIAPRLLDKPIDDIDAIASVVDELSEVTLGVPPTAHIDHEVAQSTSGEVLADVMHHVDPVGSDLQADRHSPGARARQIQGSVEADTVARGHHDAAHADAVAGSAIDPDATRQAHDSPSWSVIFLGDLRGREGPRKALRMHFRD